MTVSEYLVLSGTNAPASQHMAIAAQIRRTQSILEAMLGFTLDPELRLENLYVEQGKSLEQCFCLSAGNVSDEVDEVMYAYRMYAYNKLDKYLKVDPFTALNKVKLVKNGITIREFTDDQVRAQFKQGWAKFIEVCPECFCECDCRNCIQLAVDADWSFNCDSSVGDCLPDDLAYLWADMITYYVNCKKDVKSESIGAHSYTKFDRSAPEQESTSIKILKKYAGPLGTLNKVII